MQTLIWKDEKKGKKTMITLYIGRSAAGKDYFFKKDVANGATPIVSYTTRPMRDGEVDGIDYHFVSKEAFKKMIADGDKLTEYQEYQTLVNEIEDTWYYGTPLLDVTKNYVGVVDVTGAEAIIPKYNKEEVKVIYVYAPYEVREARAMKRGSFDKAEWDRREEKDTPKFSHENIARLEKILGHSIIYLDNTNDIPKQIDEMDAFDEYDR